MSVFNKPKKMYFSDLNNNIDLSKVRFKDMIKWTDIYKNIPNIGGHIFNNKIWCESFLELAHPEDLIIETVLYNRVTANKFNYVYIIAGTHKGETKYKIGKANVLKDRIKRFDVKIPFDIDLLFSFRVKDALSLEGELHNKFKEKRLSGEWFDLSKDDMMKILKISMLREVNDYYKQVDEDVKEYKKSKWMKDKEYIKYLESMLVFNKIHFEARI